VWLPSKGKGGRRASPGLALCDSIRRSTLAKLVVFWGCHIHLSEFTAWWVLLSKGIDATTKACIWSNKHLLVYGLILFFPLATRPYPQWYCGFRTRGHTVDRCKLLYCSGHFVLNRAAPLLTGTIKQHSSLT
jgi:hypothetical protein